MCETIGYKVKALHRSKIGSLTVKDLRIGEWRYLTKKKKIYYKIMYLLHLYK